MTETNIAELEKLGTAGFFVFGNMVLFSGDGWGGHQAAIFLSNNTNGGVHSET